MTRHNECFEEDDPQDIDVFDGIEYGHCKLSLMNTMTRHIAGLEDQAWKIALPRVLDKGIVQQLFEPQQVNAILQNFTIAGVFKGRKQQFTLHEEIRDLLLAYARSKKWLNTKEVAEIHKKIWTHLYKSNLEKLSPSSRSKIQGLGGETLNYMEKDLLEAEIYKVLSPAMVIEEVYHRIASRFDLNEFNHIPGTFAVEFIHFPGLGLVDKWEIAKSYPSSFLNIPSAIENSVLIF